MSKKPSPSSTPTSPPPATGGTHVWNPSLGVWETLEATIQPWDDRHPDKLLEAPVETPLKDA